MARQMGHYLGGRSNNPGGGNEDGRGGKKNRVHPPVYRGGPNGVTVADAGCIERLAEKNWDRCGAALAPDSGAFCNAHKLVMRKSV